jgi:exopolysaccharide production protein ExoQ
MALIATVLVIIGIIGLFRLDRYPEARTSKALWVPVIYLLINSSRPVGAWFAGPTKPIAVDGIYSDPLGQAIDLVLLALALAALIARGKKVGSLLRTSGPILLFFSYAGLSILWSDFPYVTFKHWFKGLEDIVMVLVVVTDGDPVMAVKRLLTRAGFILIPLSLLFSMYYPSLGRVFTKSYEAEYVGVTEQKNQLGIICMIFGLASLWCILKAYRDRGSSARRRQLLVHGAMLGIAIWLLTMSHSLTSSMCLILAGTVMALVSRRSSGAESARVHFLSAAAMCCALIPLFLARSLVESFGRDATLSGRTEIWQSVIGLVQNPWLGAGYETFLMGPRLVELRKLYQNSFQEAHNGYLEIYLNLGWIGVSLFAFLLITGYQKVVAAVRREPTVGSLSLAFLIAVAINGLTEAPFRMMTATIFFLLWAIMGASKAIPVSPRRGRERTVDLEVPVSHSAVTVGVHQ